MRAPREWKLRRPARARSVPRGALAALAVALWLSISAAAAAEPAEKLAHADALARAGELEAALTAYDAVLAESPASRDAQIGRARVLAWAGRSDDAMSAANELLARDAADVEALALRARLLGWSRRLAEAERDARRALELAPHSAELELLLGDVLAWSGRAPEAQQAYGRALALAPEWPEARERVRASERAQRPGRGRVAFATHYEAPSGLGAWWRQDLQLAWRARERSSLQGGLVHLRRYGERDVQGTLGFAHARPSGWQLAASAAIGPGADFAARYACELELARPVRERGSLLLRYRRSWYRGGVAADAFSPGAELRASEWLTLAARYHLTRVAADRLGHAGSLRLELLPERRAGAFVGMSYGSEAFAPTALRTSRSHARTTSASAGVRLQHRSGLGLQLAYTFESLAGIHRRHGALTSVSVDF